MEILTRCEQWITETPTAQLPELIGALVTLQEKARFRLMTCQVDTPPPQPAQTERYLTVEQVCERFNVRPKWLYRHKKKMPYSQPSRKMLLFPEQAVTRWFATRKGG